MRDLLRQVSRSFYLSLQWLPAGVREPIRLAYLLARTSDTIADTTRLPADERLAALDQFGRRIAGTDSSPVNFQPLSADQGNPAEAILLTRTEEALTLLNRLPEQDRHLVRQVLATIISGQSLDLQRFANASESNVIPLATADDLEDYTYRVAGCVGEFWTRVCFAHLQPRCERSEADMIRLGVHYGQGLQLVNILRDLPRDLRQGRCYLPLEQLRSVSLAPRELLDARSEPALRPVFDAWLDRAQAHLDEGWLYTNAYPHRLARVRISCALPILIGWRTIDLVRTGRVLDPATRIKVSRRSVQWLVLRTLLSHPFGFLWCRLGRDRCA
ncbi:MAG: squalene/phytoene synthase family protein [Verrucomicrobia bacterium]|nr:squalene/phytoene synthase family protein [Verrucomicrobiota bacterium]